MLSNKQIQAHLRDMEKELKKKKNKKIVTLTRRWVREFPSEPGYFRAE